MAASCGETGCRCGKDLLLGRERLLADVIAAQERGRGDDAVSAVGGSQGFVTEPADLKGGPQVDSGAGQPPGPSPYVSRSLQPVVSFWMHSASLFCSTLRPAIGC